MAYRLTEIPVEDLPKLRDLYISKTNSEKNYIGFTTIENYISWFRQNPSLNHVTFFCLNGDFSDGTFAVIDHSFACADTLNVSLENLKKLLRLIDYSRGITILHFRCELRETIIAEVQLANVQSAHEFLLYCLAKEKAPQLDDTPPDGIYLKSLDKLDDVTKAHSVWPYRNQIEHSLELFERLARYNPCVGVFTDDGTLVSWILRFQNGLLGAFQTDDQHLRKGYGSLALRAICKKIARLGHDIYASISEANTASRTVFANAGFALIGRVCTITVKRSSITDCLIDNYDAN